MKKLLKSAILVLLSLLTAGLGLPGSFLQARTTAATTLTTKTKTHTTNSRHAKTARRAPSRREKGQRAPTAERVSEIQRALAKDGSFQGTPNGKWDDSTVAAMKKFQAAHGLNSSGKLDARTLQGLGLGSQTAGVAAPTAPVRISSTRAPAGGGAVSKQ